MCEDALTRAELFQNYIHQMLQFDSKSYWVMSQGCVGAKMLLAPTNTLFDSYISNDYLGISQRKETIEAGINALKKYGTGAVIIDGVYSQDGDLSKFPEYISVCKKHNCLLMVDDAHGIIGVMGNKGRGKAVHYNCLGQVDIITGTFSKSFGCIGGFVAASSKSIQYLRYYADSNVFSAAITPQVTCSVLKVGINKKPTMHS